MLNDSLLSIRVEPIFQPENLLIHDSVEFQHGNQQFILPQESELQGITTHRSEEWLVNPKDTDGKNSTHAQNYMDKETQTTSSCSKHTSQSKVLASPSQMHVAVQCDETRQLEMMNDKVQCSDMSFVFLPKVI